MLPVAISSLFLHFLFSFFLLLFLFFVSIFLTQLVHTLMLGATVITDQCSSPGVVHLGFLSTSVSHSHRQKHLVIDAKPRRLRETSSMPSSVMDPIHGACFWRLGTRAVSPSNIMPARRPLRQRLQRSKVRARKGGEKKVEIGQRTLLGDAAVLGSSSTFPPHPALSTCIPLL